MITKNYIKMCEQAEEIQKAWKPKQFDCYYAKLLERNFVLAELSSVNVIEKYIYNYVYLPTQEQLQEMIKDRVFHIWGSFDSLFMTASTGKRDTHKVCWGEAKSMNELWLAFVMKEKYNKIWTGSKWVKAE